MPEDDELQSGLRDLAGDYVVSSRLRDRTAGRVQQLRRRRHASAGAAVTALLVGCAALAIPALGSDDDEPTTLTPGPAHEGATCTGDEVVVADLDGDGQMDRVFGQWVDDDGNPVEPVAGEYRLEVCTAAGTAASITGVSNGEAISAIDVEGDGRAELLAGGTSVSAVYLTVVVLVDGELEAVVAGDTQLVVSAGVTAFGSDPSMPAETTAYGCEDLSGDGTNELVQVTASFSGDEVSWTKEGYALDGAAVADVHPEGGTDPFSGDRASYPAGLTIPCPDASDAGSQGVTDEFVVEPADWPDAGVAARHGDAVTFYDDEGTELGTFLDPELIAQLESGSALQEITFDGSSFAAAPATTAEEVPSEPPHPGAVGHWRWAVPSPDGDWVLAQWSGECEVPVAYLIPTSGGTARPASGTDPSDGSVESIGAGWTPDGRAIVTFPSPACGGGLDEPGTYLIDPDTGDTTLRFVAGSGPNAAFRWRRVTEGAGSPETPTSQGTPPDLAQAEPGREITFEGIGEWRIGQVLDPSQVDQLGEGDSCGYWGPAEPSHDGDERPSGLVEGADTASPAIVKIQVYDNPRYRTASGVGVGTKLETLRRIYGEDLVVDRADQDMTPTGGLTGWYGDVAAIRRGERALTFLLSEDVVRSVKVSTAERWGDDEGCA